MKLHLSLLVILFMADACWTQSCTLANWWGSFDHEGWSYCDPRNQYMTGLWRNDGGSWDGIYKIEHAKCCVAPYGMEGLASSCQNANWWGALDGNNQWAVCPDGHFMQGLFRTGANQGLHNIEEAECCKPQGLPNKYDNCYEENVWGSFDHKGLSECREGYFMAGIFKGICDELYCLELFKCCKMIELERPPSQDEKSKE